MKNKKVGYDSFLAYIYDYSPYFGKERYNSEYATNYYFNYLPNKTEGIILEMVTCTGMLTIPMAKAGYIVDSIDASEEVQDIAIEKIKLLDSSISKNITFYCSDVFEFETENKYSAIVMPDSFLCAIDNEKSQKKLIKKCYNLLKDRGVLIIDVFTPWEDIIKKGELNQCSRFRTNDGKLYIVYVHHIVNKEKQVHTFEFIHEEYETKTRFEHKVVYRYLYSSQLKKLIESNGFIIMNVDKHFNFGTINEQVRDFA